MPNDNKFASLLAMVPVVAVPVIGVWEVFRQDEPPGLRTFRLLVVLLFGLFLAVLALLGERLAKAGMRRHLRKLEALNGEFAKIIRTILRRADPRTFRTTDDSKYTSLLAMVAVLAVPVVGVWEVLRQDEPPSLRTFRLLVALLFGLFLAVLALLAEQLAKAGMKSDARKLETLNSELVEMVRAILRRADPNTFQTTFVNRHVEDILGYPVGSWLSNPSFWVQHLHPEDRERTLAFSAKAIDERRDHELEYRMIAADGRTVWLHEVVNVIVANGVPSELVGVSGDITACKQAEEALRESEERLRLATQAGRMCAAEWDVASNLIARSAESAILSWMDAPTNETYEQMLARVHVDDREKFVAAVAALTPENSTCQINYRVLVPDSSIVWLEENGRAFFDSQGKLLRLVSLVADVTERKLAEANLSTLSRRLIEAQEEERSRLAGELRDDLNQRMALLQIGLGQFEQEVPGLTSQAREQLHTIAEVATKVSASIHNLSHQLHPSVLDLAGLVASVRGLCRELSDQHDLQVQFVHQGIPEQIPEDVGLCLFRIAQEALRNVVKHSGAAAAKVELSGHDDHIELCISDCGAGFSPGSTKRASGLGLISMQERLRLVGGHLSVESEPSHGTRIRVRVLRHIVDPYVDSGGVP